ncbi:MAG: DUF3427 domain-containing protein [Candidatus Methanomethylophilaceae archaeon]|nr:DUF3427 domain-containing protein [Candidatus Methanomethylophilaceae archaeon]
MRLEDGIYEHVISESIDGALSELGMEDAEVRGISPEDSPEVLSQYIAGVVRRALESSAGRHPSNRAGRSDAISEEVSICNGIIRSLIEMTGDGSLSRCLISGDGKQLLAVRAGGRDLIGIRPPTPMSFSTLFTNKRGEPNLMEELNKEIMTSDEVDFLVSFIKWSGIRTIRDSLESFARSGGKLRILTTTYLGITDAAAIDWLSRLPNSSVRISYENDNTRLHAKAYVFRRRTKLDSAIIGSSNLSRAAVTDGAEWNMKVTSPDAPYVMASVGKAFEECWNSQDFAGYDPDRDGVRLREALSRSKISDSGSIDLPLFDIRPYPYQEEILAQLEAEREIHHSYRNLVVAATGTGKTVIAAFDYRRFIGKPENRGRVNRLLFVAHREEILRKSLQTFRMVLHDQNFGGICTGNIEPPSMDHVFMSVQTLRSRGYAESMRPDFYDFIIVDETHHAGADSYHGIFGMRPKVLLGLTATPERMDGKSILSSFGGRVAGEIRLPEAIDRGLLVPFHYFAVTDPTDISKVKFTRGRFDEEELTQIYLRNDGRIGVIVDALRRYTPDIGSVKGLGFCVSKVHAKYMADKFCGMGIPSVALTSDSPDDVRRDAMGRLSRGEINFIFSVDLYNEGVDIPEVNTELFLRPTGSMTVFIQQLGRGLRLCPSQGKTELTVLDFVGQFDAKYDLYLRQIAYLTSCSAMSVGSQIKNGFIGLPTGCYIGLEEIAKNHILDSISNTNAGKRRLETSVREFIDEFGRDPTLSEFLGYANTEPSAIYKGGRTLHGMAVSARGGTPDPEDEKVFSKAFLRALSIDSVSWIEAMLSVMDGIGGRSESMDRYVSMLYFTFHPSSGAGGSGDAWEFADWLRGKPDYVSEFREILHMDRDAVKFMEESVDIGHTNPLRLHCSYSNDQIRAALGIIKAGDIGTLREGVYYDKANGCDLLFVTLNKKEGEYSPTTMYEDYPIGESEFNWQSQSTTSEDSATGRRYINHDDMGSSVLLFARERKTNSYGGSMAYVFLGKVHYISHSGSRPMTIRWRMERSIPMKVLKWSPTAIR